MLLLEEKVESFTELLHVLETMDPDEGIRAIGNYKDEACLVFITKSSRGYGMAICSAESGEKDIVPGRRLLVTVFEAKSALLEFLNRIIALPLVAYRY